MGNFEDRAKNAQERREASRTIAFVYEDAGFEWTSLNEAIPEVAKALDLDISKMKRSQAAIACLRELRNYKLTIPDNYVSPWERSTQTVRNVVKRSRKKSDRIRDFYGSWAWKKLSYHIRKLRGNRCESCGATPKKHGVRIVADHIKSVRKHWHLRLDPSNIQILCDDCNMGKSFQDETDWR